MHSISFKFYSAKKANLPTVSCSQS